MSAARESILATIRTSLGRGPLADAQRRTLGARMETHTRPMFGGDLPARLLQKLQSRSATVEHLAGLSDVPAAVQRFFVQHDLPSRLVCASAFLALGWPDAVETRDGPARQDDTTSLTPCLAGVAETGSLVLHSGAATPTTLNFVPENHIVVLRRDQIVAHFEDVWVLLRRRDMPRTINVISGPSRTADVEQTIQLGAHGPRRLHVVLLG